MKRHLKRLEFTWELMNKTKFPEYITLGYTRIEFILMSTNIARNIGEQQGSYIGSVPYKIYLDQEIINLGGPDASNLVIHEVMHHIYNNYECDDKTSEEILINTLANGITELIYRSELKAWFLEQK